MKEGKLVYVNGLLLEAEQAYVGIEDLALNRGYGVFDFFRVRDGVPLFMEAHLHRLQHSARQMHLTLQLNDEQLSQLVHHLIAQNACKDCGIKILVTGGISANGYSLGSSPNVVISTHELPPQNPAHYTSGLRLITHEYRRDLPAVKTINYLMGIWLQPMVTQAGADDVLYCWQGEVHECPRSNIFIVSRSGEVFTPVHGVLHGITRRHVLNLSRHRYPTHDTEVTRDMLYDAAEIFVTSTTKRIAPVVSIDGDPVGNGQPGPITRQLMDDLQQFEWQYLEERRP
ncbi:MAG: aminotransferase class IV [Chitinophagaceae bacterium]|nr:aminotransferase class IV [Chitinophagaceae bacterium]